MRVKVGMEDFGGIENGVGENEGPRIVLKNVNEKKEWYETGFVGLRGTCGGCGRSGR